MSIFIKDIVNVIEAEVHSNDTSTEIKHVSIDSRSLLNTSNTLFFALIGPHHDAHLYLKELISTGVKNFVVQYIPIGLEDAANFLVVKNALHALQKFASYYRRLFHFPVIGITGSNGKTIVKEWLNFLLSPDFNIIRSPKSYNSQVGVPLSIIGINELHNFGIFEAGISTINEMDNLQKIILPTIGVLTNIGSAHDEGFKNREEKIQEKLKLFKDASVLIYEKEPSIESLVPKNLKTFTWSKVSQTADVFIETEKQENRTVLIVYFKDNTFKLIIPFTEVAALENSMHCLSVMLYLDYNFATFEKRMALLYPVEMRLKVKNGIHNCTLIDDSYSSDFQSLKIALDFLENQNQNTKKTIILSDIFQSGLEREDLYFRISELITSSKINRVFCIGEVISQYQKYFNNVTIYSNTNDFIKDFTNLKFEKETILIKGSRAFEFEKIVHLLEEKTHETVLEINLNALVHNLNYYKSKLKPETKLMVMVKAFGYGSGGFEIAKLLEHHKIDYLGVAFADEGISLRQAGIKLPIMVLNPELTSYVSIIQNQLEPEIYNLKGLHEFVKITKEKGLKDYPIHIKLNTGMNRLGFDSKDIETLIPILSSNSSIQVKSILSHLASSDNKAHHLFTLQQINDFETNSTKITSFLKINPIRHICNSSGISNYPDAQFDMVRLGIGLYGISNEEEETKQLEVVGTLKSVISQLRTIQKGESVGYNRNFIANKSTVVATIPVGYADGISRAWGNEKGYVTINNTKATIIGSICMDMLMVDVTTINCMEGDEVIIFGKNPTVTDFAKVTNTIAYEILTSISSRVKRIFYRE